MRGRGPGAGPKESRDPLPCGAGAGTAAARPTAVVGRGQLHVSRVRETHRIPTAHDMFVLVHVNLCDVCRVQQRAVSPRSHPREMNIQYIHVKISVQKLKHGPASVRVLRRAPNSEHARGPTVERYGSRASSRAGGDPMRFVSSEPNRHIVLNLVSGDSADRTVTVSPCA
jgi:hypothetical protein